ncbi:Uncharacterized protein HZ326_9190 [Fusarium oxysporum f. sp. albedinis]|nr:Uncharacterized protein HZ326_9190 [Fusarium oxysporum f. sp. albedinis]
MGLEKAISPRKDVYKVQQASALHSYMLSDIGDTTRGISMWTVAFFIHITANISRAKRLLRRRMFFYEFKVCSIIRARHLGFRSEKHSSMSHEYRTV